MSSEMNIGGLDFKWDLDQGEFLFEGQDAVLFWIPSAMKTFFDTIEEISGEEASQLVFETTGFRQGLVVGKYFEKMKNVDVDVAAKMITNTYASAGWGRTEILNLDFTTKTLVAHIKDSWEYKINVAQGKREGGIYLAAHYAGIFTVLFGTQIWYKIVQHQLDGHEHTIVQYFPSDITVSNNIHELSRKKESEQIQRLEVIVNNKTKELKELVQKLSSPIIPVLEGIVVVPLIGKYDEDRSESLIADTLNNLPKYKPTFLVLDLTGINKDIDNYSVSFIEKIGTAACLIGIQTILVGIPPKLAMTILKSGANLAQFDCFQTLQHGIHYAIAQTGKTII